MIREPLTCFSREPVIKQKPSDSHGEKSSNHSGDHRNTSILFHVWWGGQRTPKHKIRKGWAVLSDSESDVWVLGRINSFVTRSTEVQRFSSDRCGTEDGSFVCEKACLCA